MALNKYNTQRPFFGFEELFFPSPFLRDPFDDWMPVLSNFNRVTDDMVLRHSSPGYEINESDDKYQIAIDVPGVKASDITAQLEDDGRVLHLSGGRKVLKDGATTETKFSKRFTIGDNVDKTKLTADLSDGVLTVTAPKVKKEEPEPMKIEITEQGKAITDGKVETK
jgi:HSP20 family protein